MRNIDAGSTGDRLGSAKAEKPLEHASAEHVLIASNIAAIGAAALSSDRSYLAQVKGQ